MVQTGTTPHTAQAVRPDASPGPPGETVTTAASGRPDASGGRSSFATTRSFLSANRFADYRGRACDGARGPRRTPKGRLPRRRGLLGKHHVRATTTPTGLWRSARFAAGAAYAAQGFGYATVVTSLPALKERQGIDDTQVSLVVLLVCVAAATWSALAGRIARLRGSRTALSLGLLAQSIAVVGVAASSLPGLFVGGFVLYGLGLGMVAAAAGIQGVLVQRILGRPVMSSFFACYTAAAIIAAFTLSGLAAQSGATTWTLVAAGLVLVAVSVHGRRWLVAHSPGVWEVSGVGARSTAARRAPLPRGGIWFLGGVVLAAFVADSAVGTWSSIYLDDVLHASPGVVPLGYAAYQATILVTRLVADRWVGRSGRTPVAAHRRGVPRHPRRQGRRRVPRRLLPVDPGDLFGACGHAARPRRRARPRRGPRRGGGRDRRARAPPAR